MKTFVCASMASTCLIILSSPARAQTEGAAAIARETHARLAEQQLPVLPPRVVPPPVVTDAIVRERLPARVADGLVPTPVTDRYSPAVITPPGGVVEGVVTARPVVTSRVPAVSGVAAYSNAYSKMRYGFYDDGLVDDNWFYDYYEIPVTVAVQPASGSAPGYRTSWRYDPAAEQRLFRW
jgi:hypothetical protein